MRKITFFIILFVAGQLGRALEYYQAHEKVDPLTLYDYAHATPECMKAYADISILKRKDYGDQETEDEE